MPETMARRTAERAMLRYAPQAQCFMLGGGAANFVAQICDEKPKALIERGFFEETLPAQRIAHESRGDKIGEHFQIAHL
jgi:hypothetical protein